MGVPGEQAHVVNTVAVHANSPEEAQEKLRLMTHLGSVDGDGDGGKVGGGGGGKDEGCCFKTLGFQGGAVIPANRPIPPFSIEFTPQVGL